MYMEKLLYLKETIEVGTCGTHSTHVCAGVSMETIMYMYVHCGTVGPTGRVPTAISEHSL